LTGRRDHNGQQVQVRQATIMSGDTAADMTSGATVGLLVAEDVSLSPRV
jgi:hypothetical protein